MLTDSPRSRDRTALASDTDVGVFHVEDEAANPQAVALARPDAGAGEDDSERDVAFRPRVPYVGTGFGRRPKQPGNRSRSPRREACSEGKSP